MVKGTALAARVRDATAAVLTPLGPKVAAKVRWDGLAPLFDVVASTAGTEHSFSAGWAGEGWQTDVERLVTIAPQLEVVYARRLSEEAKQWLEGRHLGWVDEAGSARITLASGLVVYREPQRSETQSPTPTGWTRTMLAAAEAMLAGVPPTVEAVEDATGVSRGGAANALARLERRGLLDRPPARRGRGVARYIVDLDKLIDEYAEAAATFRAKQPALLVHRLWKDPMDTLATEVGPCLAGADVTWAVTGAAASTLLAPYLGDVTVVELYVGRGLLLARERLAGLLGGREVERGQRIEVRELPTAVSAKGPEVRGIQVALPSRVYADLLAAGGRFAEAAHHLREVRGVGPAL